MGISKIPIPNPTLSRGADNAFYAKDGGKLQFFGNVSNLVYGITVLQYFGIKNILAPSHIFKWKNTISWNLGPDLGKTFLLK